MTKTVQTSEVQDTKQDKSADLTAILATSGTGLLEKTAPGSWQLNSNAVYTTGSYANPTWITSIDYSKLTGAVPQWNQNTEGNAATATKLETARTINGVAFDGTANITVPADMSNVYTKTETTDEAIAMAIALG